jgi:RNA polymerase sigma factor (sigma-70 family)
MVAHLGVRGGDADDLTQEILLEGLAAIKAGRRPDQLTKWFKGIARHKVADLPRVITTDREPADRPGPSAQSVLVRREMGDLLARTLQGLPESDRELLDQIHRSGLSRKDIADRLGVTVEVVHARMGRALDRLRGKLSAHFTTIASVPEAPVTLAAVRALRPIFREAVTARHLEDRPEADAARRLGLSEATLRARLQSAYELLGYAKAPDFALARRELRG